MSFLKNIKYWFLRRTAKMMSAPKSYFDFDSARSFAILFDAQDEHTLKRVFAFVESLKLKQKKVRALGYCASKATIEQTAQKMDIDYFALSDTSFLGKPKADSVKEFCDADVDVLININNAEQIPSDYVVCMSKAKMKIGKDNGNNYLYNFIINMKGDKKIDSYLHQVLHYMSIIKSK